MRNTKLLSDPKRTTNCIAVLLQYIVQCFSSWAADSYKNTGLEGAGACARVCALRFATPAATAAASLHPLHGLLADGHTPTSMQV